MAERKRTQRKSTTRRKSSSGRGSSSRGSTSTRSRSTAQSKSTKRKSTQRKSTKPKSTQRKSTQRDERILGTAPSSPDIRKLELMEPSAEAKAAEPSDEDAMGKDKRRQVVGHSYGPSRKSQIMFFVIVAAVIAVIIGGYSLAVAQFDQPPEEYPDEAPWTENQSPGIRPQ